VHRFVKCALASVAELHFEGKREDKVPREEYCRGKIPSLRALGSTRMVLPEDVEGRDQQR